MKAATDGQLSPDWQAALASRLEPAEEALAWFEPDLDASLRYDRGLVVLTGGRLLAAERGGERWHSWPLPVGISLRNVEQGSAGTLELLLGGQDLVAIGVLADLGCVPAGVVRQRRLHQRAHPLDLLGLDLQVGELALDDTG